MSRGRVDWESAAHIRGLTADGVATTVLVDSQGQLYALMKGKYGTAYVPVTVDADGNLVSVMKGDYEGALKTLAIDDQGRILAVLTDPEDVFGNPNYIGAGELAARLGSIKHFDKRGEVIFLDDFESATLKWTLLGSGTGHTEARSTDYARSKDYSLKLVTGSENNSYAGMTHNHYYPVAGKLGCEFSFACGDTLFEIQFYISIYTGTEVFYVWGWYNSNTEDVIIINAVGSEVVIIPESRIYVYAGVFNTLKVVFDTTTTKYVRLLANDEEIDISEHGLYGAANLSAPHVTFTVLFYTRSATAKTAYIDDVIITQNEPG